jgi:hypothetical protein
MMLEIHPFLVSSSENDNNPGFEEDSGYNEKGYSPRIKKGSEFK